MQTVDLLAGQAHAAAAMLTATPRILVFDSGLGGLTVFKAIAKARPDAQYIYIADNAGFPYGAWQESDLVERLVRLMDMLIAQHRPDCVVIACNTASTLALPALRARFAVPFVGTVPAIKSAAERSVSRMFSVLATPATVARDYTRTLIESFAAGCRVTLVGSVKLATLAEAAMAGKAISDADILAEIEPCFIEHDGRRTDVVTLSCTHYPLLLPKLVALAPWPVTWIDPAPAIARRVVQLFGPAMSAIVGTEHAFGFTAGAATPAQVRVLAEFDLELQIAAPDLARAAGTRP